MSYTIPASSVFPIGIFHGNQKPLNLNEYFNEFITEIIDLIENGMIFEGKKKKKNFTGLICDALARAFVLCTKTHSGYFSCTKCQIRGAYVSKRVCFLNIHNSPRNYVDFRNQLQSQHHSGCSPLLQICDFGLNRGCKIAVKYMGEG